jgi:hypothetical protein
LRNQVVADHRRAFRLQDARQPAGSRGRDLEHDLVGLDLDQDFIAFDEVAFFLAPAHQGGGRYRFG